MSFVSRLIAALLVLAGVSPVFADPAFPAKPITVVVPFPPGGSTDRVTRLITQKLSEYTGQPAIVQNRPGAAGAIAAQAVLSQPADGYTVFVGHVGTHAIDPHLNAQVGFDANRDFRPVTSFFSFHSILVVPASLPANNIKELIAYAKKNPDKLNFGSSGNGSAPHLAGILFNSVTGTDMLHIPFKGGAPAVQSLIAGDTQVIVGTSPVVLPQVRGGRVRPLAITTQERSDAIPNIMGMKEAGLADYNISFSFGLYAPMKTPPEDVKKIFDAAVKVLKRQDIRDKLATQGMDPLPNNSPNEFRLQNQREAPLWSKLIEASGAKVD